MRTAGKQLPCIYTNLINSMNKDKLPWFPFYYEKFLIGTAEMTDTEVGAYLRLLIKQYDKGHLDCKSNGLKYKKVAEKFKKDDNGMLINSTMDEIRKNQNKYIEKQRVNGSKGGRPKKPNETQNNPPLLIGLTQSEPKKTTLHNININKENIKRKKLLLLEQEGWVEVACMQTKTLLDNLPDRLEKFLLEAASKNKLDQTLSELQSYFINWCRFNPDQVTEAVPPVVTIDFKKKYGIK